MKVGIELGGCFVIALTLPQGEITVAEGKMAAGLTPGSRSTAGQPEGERHRGAQWESNVSTRRNLVAFNFPPSWRQALDALFSWGFM